MLSGQIKFPVLRLLISCKTIRLSASSQSGGDMTEDVGRRSWVTQVPIHLLDNLWEAKGTLQRSGQTRLQWQPAVTTATVNQISVGKALVMVVT